MKDYVTNLAFAAIIVVGVTVFARRSQTFPKPD
jgi:hypothetical protein